MEDPFGDNVVRCTTKDSLKRIRNAFKETHLAIETENQDAIINKIASTEISNMIRSTYWSC